MRVFLPRARWLLRDSGVIVHDRLLAIAGAVIDADHQCLRTLLEQYERRNDLHPIGMLLKNAFKRHLLEGDTESAVNLRTTSQAFEARFPIPGRHLALDTCGAGRSHALSGREMESRSLLAATLTVKSLPVWDLAPEQSKTTSRRQRRKVAPCRVALCARSCKASANELGFAGDPNRPKEHRIGGFNL